MTEHTASPNTFDHTTLTELAPALALAQLHMVPAVYDKTNPHFRSKYTSLASVLGSILPALNEQGIALLQHPSFDSATGLVSVCTVLMHKSGQYMSSTCSLPLGGRKDGHALKSATTYLRRIGAISICGLPEEDDDGNRASARRSQPARPQREEPLSDAPVTDADVALYRDMVGATGLDPKHVAAFFEAHGREEASDLTANHLDRRLQWVKSDSGQGTVKRWMADNGVGQ
mgnify:CR=1 FL=1|jgi:hypothetical protein